MHKTNDVSKDYADRVVHEAIRATKELKNVADSDICDDIRKVLDDWNNIINRDGTAELSDYEAINKIFRLMEKM